MSSTLHVIADLLTSVRKCKAMSIIASEHLHGDTVEILPWTHEIPFINSQWDTFHFLYDKHIKETVRWFMEMIMFSLKYNVLFKQSFLLLIIVLFPYKHILSLTWSLQNVIQIDIDMIESPYITFICNTKCKT